MTIKTRISNQRGLIVTPFVALGALVGVLAFSAAPALAAAPEVPVTNAATSVLTKTAVLHGVLQPAAASTEVLVEHAFFLAPRGALCTEGFGTPETPGLTPGAKGEAVTDGVRNLEPSTEYAVCLAVRNTAEEAWTFGNQVTFTTAALPPSLISESTAGDKGTEARVEGLLNPNNQITECNIEYGEAVVAVTEHTIACEPPTLEGFSEQGAGVTLTGLKENTAYIWRIVLKNAKAETTTGAETDFTTALKPEAPEKLEAPAIDITSTTATLKGVLNANAPGNAGSYEFLYKQSATKCEGGEVVPGGMSGTSPEPVEAVLAGLLPDATYTFCLRATNASGETTISAVPVHFTTSPVRPEIPVEEEVEGHHIDFLTASEQTSSSVVLSGRVNPNGAATTCELEYGTEAGVYPHKVACAPQPGSGRAAVAVSQQIEGLSGNTEYHWRLSATNAAGPSTSPDQTFGDFYTVEPPTPPTPTSSEALPGGRESSPPPPAAFPALSAPSIAQLDAKEAQEAKSIPTPTGTGTKTLTNAEKLSKALKVCLKKFGAHPPAKRVSCERQAHRKYGKGRAKK